MTPLAFFLAGQTGVVKDIDGGRKMRQKLTRMGIICGATISIVKNDNFGPLILSVEEGKIAIGRGIARKIFINESIE